MFTTENLAGKLVAFTYKGEERTVQVEKVRECNNGNSVIIGNDVNKNMAYRTFTISNVENFRVV